MQSLHFSWQQVHQFPLFCLALLAIIRDNTTMLPCIHEMTHSIFYNMLLKMFSSIIAVLVFFVMDVIYLSILSNDYLTMLTKIQNGKKPLVNWSFAVMSYVVLAIALLSVVFPYAQELQGKGHSLWAAALRSGLLIGFAIYGVYNTTVLSVFKDYSVRLALIDTLWGSIGFFTSALVFLYFQRHVFFSS